jgi:pyruvate/2-oxoglutarate dehydrogenase complex dihydrolipoamide acyltransferase (E2) component
MDTPNGLVVPVIKDVEQKSLIELATELAQTSAKARITAFIINTNGVSLIPWAFCACR